MRKSLFKFGKKLTLLTIVFMMIVSMLPITAFAESDVYETNFVADDKAPWRSRASVTLNDGTIIEVEGGDQSYFNNDVKLVVKVNNTEGSIAINHGILNEGYLDYEFSVLDAEGNHLANEIQGYWLTIKNAAINEDWCLLTGNGNDMSEMSSVVASEGSITISNNQWQYMIFTKGSSVRVMSGEFGPSTDTFTSNGGKYTIEYILSNYNVFVEGDYEGSHVTGPMIIGGDAGMTSLGGISNADESFEGILEYKHEVPAYIGKKSQGYKQVFNNNID